MGTHQTLDNQELVEVSLGEVRNAVKAMPPTSTPRSQLHHCNCATYEFVQPFTLASAHLLGLAIPSILPTYMEGGESHHVKETRQGILCHPTYLPPYYFALPSREEP